MDDAFARHLYDNGPVDVPHHGFRLRRRARARPRRERRDVARASAPLQSCVLREHARDGLSGVEAFYAGYDPGERARWTDLADELGLVCTGGADSHGPDDPIGIELPDDRAAELLAWLA